MKSVKTTAMRLECSDFDSGTERAVHAAVLLMGIENYSVTLNWHRQIWSDQKNSAITPQAALPSTPRPLPPSHHNNLI